MGDFNFKECVIYLDDIIIIEQIDSHIERLDKVFERFASYYLKLKPSEFDFLRQKLLTFGHVVADEGIQSDPEKIKAYMKWPFLRNVKETRKFLGFIGYYKKSSMDLLPLHEHECSFSRTLGSKKQKSEK